MNKIQEKILADGLIRFLMGGSSLDVYTLKGSEDSHNSLFLERFKVKQVITDLFSSGLDPLFVIGFDNDFKRPNFLISKIWPDLDEETKSICLMFIQKESFSNIDYKNKLKLLDELISSVNETIAMEVAEKFYTNGFLLVQGNDREDFECQAALYGNNNIFTILDRYQKDSFDFKRRYKNDDTELTLIEMLEEEMENITNNSGKSNTEKTINLIKEINIKNSFNELDSKLDKNDKKSEKMKI